MSDPSLARYRVYAFDGHTRSLKGDWFTADNDDAAIAHVHTENAHAQWELWDHQRMIARSAATVEPFSRAS